VTVTAAGDFSNWPLNVWADRTGLTATCEKDKGKLSIHVAQDAVPGIYWLRLFGSDGASTLKAFIVGTLPEIAESEPNDAPDKPQSVEPRIVVNGKLAKGGDVDGYRVELKQGQTLVASLQANSVLGSPMDAVLQVCDLVERPYGPQESRSVEAYTIAQNHDAVGLDPQLVFQAPRDGQYLIRLFAFPATPDSTIRFAGGDDYVYRLTLTTGGFVDHALPLALPAQEKNVNLEGWNLPPGAGAVSAAAAVPKSDPMSPPDSTLQWLWRTGAAGAIPVSRVEQGNVVVCQDSKPVSDPLQVTLPVSISGRLAENAAIHSFAFEAKKGQTLRLSVVAKALGFPTDAVISILDEAGKVLTDADDTGRDDRDPQIDFAVPADGSYRVTVRDLHGRGGLRFVYRLTIAATQPDFSLSLAGDSFVKEKRKPLEIPVTVTVRDGLREAIEITAIGLPPGVTAEPVKFQPTEDAPMQSSGSGRRSRRSSSQGPSGPSVKLILKGDPTSLQPGGVPVRIEGRTGGASALVRTARFPLNLPLAGSHHAVWLTVKD
jgi:hypothetical protein